MRYWVLFAVLFAGCAGAPVDDPEPMVAEPLVQPIAWTCDAAIVLQAVEMSRALQFLPAGYTPADPATVLDAPMELGEAALAILALECDTTRHAILSVLIESPEHDTSRAAFTFYAVRHLATVDVIGWPVELVAMDQVDVDIGLWQPITFPREHQIGMGSVQLLDSTARIDGGSTYFSEGKAVHVWSEADGRGLLRGVLGADGSYGPAECSGPALDAFLGDSCAAGQTVGAVWSGLTINGELRWDPSGELRT